MKLLNLNIYMKIDNNEKIIQYINENSFDIVTFQESMRALDDSVFPMYNSSNIIKNNILYKNSFFGPLYVSDKFIKNGIVTRDFGGFVEQGNELITNYKIVSATNHFIHNDYGLFINTDNFRVNDHGRAFTDVLLDLDGELLQIINIHGIWNENKLGDLRTINQINSLLLKVRDDIPSIVVGDFNLLPNSLSISIVNRRMKNLIEEYNIKNTRYGTENMICDYVFVNNKIKVNDFRVVDSDISDHLPIILDFDIIKKNY